MSDHQHDAVPADRALADLREGNGRFAGERARRPHQGAKRREEVAAGQHPFAMVLSCSDSRVPPEVLFDCGLGDLFVVRTAGHVVDAVALASLELAVDHFGARLLVVLGHSRCGAVQACDAHTRGPGQLPGALSSIVWAIEPAVREAHRSRAEDPIQAAVETNVRNTVSKLSESRPVLTQALAEGRLTVVGAVYDLDTGLVSWLD